MTREEAIRIIETVFQDEYVYKYYDSITHQALNMAIEALSAEPTLSNMPKQKKPTPIYDFMTGKSDLISRADALMELNGACSNWQDDSKVAEIIHALPSVSAERVVRCYDCISFNGDGKECERGVLTAYNGYCSRAKMGVE